MKNLEIKALFVLASNHFRKSFSINAGVLLCMENGFSRKEFQLTVKLRPLTWKIFSAKILPLNHFRRRTKREKREREKGLTRANREREIANPENPRSSHHRQVAPRTHEPQVAPRRSHRQVAPLLILLSFSLPASCTVIDLVLVILIFYSLSLISNFFVVVVVVWVVVFW